MGFGVLLTPDSHFLHAKDSNHSSCSCPCQGLQSSFACYQAVSMPSLSANYMGLVAFNDLPKTNILCGARFVGHCTTKLRHLHVNNFMMQCCWCVWLRMQQVAYILKPCPESTDYHLLLGACMPVWKVQYNRHFLRLLVPIKFLNSEIAQLINPHGEQWHIWIRLLDPHANVGYDPSTSAQYITLGEHNVIIKVMDHNLIKQLEFSQ